MCRNSPPVSIIHISRNSDDESLSSILIFVALALYYDKFFVTPGKSISYPFVSIIFYHAFSIDVGHCNFTLFSCDGKIFGDAFVTENLYHNKLVVVESSATWLAHTKRIISLYLLAKNLKKKENCIHRIKIPNKFFTSLKKTLKNLSWARWSVLAHSILFIKKNVKLKQFFYTHLKTENSSPEIAFDKKKITITLMFTLQTRKFFLKKTLLEKTF